MDEFVRKSFEISWGNGFEVLVELISKDCRFPPRLTDPQVGERVEWSQMMLFYSTTDTERGFSDLLAYGFVFGLCFDGTFSRFDSYPL